MRIHGDSSIRSDIARSGSYTFENATAPGIALLETFSSISGFSAGINSAISGTTNGAVAAWERV